MGRWLWTLTRTTLLLATVSSVTACDNSSDHRVGNSPSGFALTEKFCSQCHAAPEPRQHTADEWPEVIARMLDHMQRSGRAMPGPDQLEKIVDYLQATT
jgi:cytochrome c5